MPAPSSTTRRCLALRPQAIPLSSILGSGNTADLLRVQPTVTSSGTGSVVMTLDALVLTRNVCAP